MKPVKKHFAIASAVFPVLTIASFLIHGCGDSTQEQGCRSDLDCKGDRVCVESICVDPGAATDSPLTGDDSAPTGTGSPEDTGIDSGSDGSGGQEVPSEEPGDDEVDGEDPQDISDVCLNGAVTYVSVPDDKFCPIPVRVLVDDSDGAPALSEQEVFDEIAHVNEYFAPSLISFAVIDVQPYTHDIVVQDGDTEIDDDEITATRSPQHVTLAFFSPTGMTNEVCGRAIRGPYTKMPVAVVKSTCTSVYQQNATVHELGHAVGLQHPHGDWDLEKMVPVAIPALDADCYTTSDWLCDTPPDPSRAYCKIIKQQGVCKPECKAPYDAYDPDPRLVMSYYSDSCQSPGTAFSAESINTMRCIVDTYYPDLGVCGDCMPDTYTQCVNGDAYYFDSCNKQGSLAQDCGDTSECTEDTCTNGACQNTPLPDDTPCGSGLICKGGSCVDKDQPQCTDGPCCNNGFFRPSSYVCETSAESEYGCPWGTNAGDDVGIRTRDRYCSGSDDLCTGSLGVWSDWDVADACDLQEVCVDGQSSCSAAPCQATAYWDANIPKQTDTTGLQSNQMINEPVSMEVKEDGSGLQFQVCKQNGSFSNDVKVSMYDAADGSADAFVAQLATKNSMCSAWTPMNSDTNYAEGEQFGGIWNLVSPWSSAADWDDYGTCSVNGNPTGTCWSGIDITMTRTCK